MHDCGLYSIEDMRPINELRMRGGSWGGALAATDRGWYASYQLLPVGDGGARHCKTSHHRSPAHWRLAVLAGTLCNCDT